MQYLVHIILYKGESFRDAAISALLTVYFAVKRQKGYRRREEVWCDCIFLFTLLFNLLDDTCEHNILPYKVKVNDNREL
jgi:uncharacterized membrane protein